MNPATRAAVTILATAWLAAPGARAAAPPAAKPSPAPQETAVTQTATGTFDVKLNPLATEDKTEGSLLGRMSLDKQFHGALEGTSRGEMLTAGTAVGGSAGYVAIERVTGTLGGRSGGFVLQHSGTMNRGNPTLSVTVVPDSGTGGLAGIAGRMSIEIGGGRHSYTFEYTLPEKQD
jgi:hypothetical protein